MEIDWCICGKKVYDSNSFYCSKECSKDEGSKPIHSTPPQTPPINLNFSITITSSFYKTSNSNAKVLSPPSSEDSSYSDSDLLSSFTSIDQGFNDYVYNYRNHGKEDMVDDDCGYTTYYSASNPIDIPSSRNQAQMTNEDAVEGTINKGTFGEKEFF